VLPVWSLLQKVRNYMLLPNLGPIFSHLCIYPREGNPMYCSKLIGKLIKIGRYGKRNVDYKFSLSQIDVPLKKMSIINVIVIQRFSCVFLTLTRFGLFPSAMWWTWAWLTSCTAVSCPYKGRSTRVPKCLLFWSKPLLSSMGCASCVLPWLDGEWFLMLLYSICLQCRLPLFDMTLQSTYKKPWYTLGLVSL